MSTSNQDHRGPLTPPSRAHAEGPTPPEAPSADPAKRREDGDSTPLADLLFAGFIAFQARPVPPQRATAHQPRLHADPMVRERDRNR